MYIDDTERENKDWHVQMERQPMKPSLQKHWRAAMQEAHDLFHHFTTQVAVRCCALQCIAVCCSACCCAR